MFEKFKKRVFGLDGNIKEEVKKLYIAFKYDTNFVDVVVQKSSIRLTLNMDFEEVIDPKWICTNITWLGRRWNGNISVHFENENDLDYIMSLVRQSFEKQL